MKNNTLLSFQIACLILSTLGPIDTFARIGATISPIVETYIPLGNNEVIKNATPMAEYDHVKTTERSYLLIVDQGTNKTIGIIPKRDSLGNPTATVKGNKLVIQPMVRISIRSGFVPLNTNESYRVVSEDALNNTVAYSIGEFKTTVAIAKTNSIITRSTIRSKTDSQQVSTGQEVLVLPGSISKIISITNNEGRVYNVKKLVKTEPDGITIMHDSGITKLYFSELPQNIQRQYNYDQAIANKYTQTERAAAAQRAAAEATKQKQIITSQKLAASAKPLQIKVIQVLQTGVLADPMEQYYTPSSSYGMSSIGGGSGGNYGGSSSSFRRSWKTIFVMGLGNTAEGNEIPIKAYQNGTHSYTDTRGAQRTVEKWILVK